MKVTSIKQQAKNAARYSVFVDEKYSFSLSESALIKSGLASGQELTPAQLKQYKKLSADDKLRAKVLRWAAMRPRTTWEVEFYLQRNKASDGFSEKILNTLSDIGLVDDLAYTRMFVNDRNMLKPTSLRKLRAELSKKRVAKKIIDQVLSEQDSGNDRAALNEVIAKKRRQLKYQDNTKLMQYLARQGFGYDDIKSALRSDTEI